jgi:hypothetical protein
MLSTDPELSRALALRAIASQLLRLKWLAAAARFEIAMRRHERALKANFNPSQPRVPRGQDGAGEWTLVAGGPSRGGGRGRYGMNFPGVTNGQLIRLDLEISRTENALQQIRQYDPNWKPTVESVTAPDSIEGAIRNAQARAEQAEARLSDLRSGIGGNFGPPLESNPAGQVGGGSGRAFDGAAWISAYRASNNMPDLFGRPMWPNDKGTVAVTDIEGRVYFGVNSGAPSYTMADQKEADNWRWALINKYPDDLQTKNIGSAPNDSFYHAESTVLLRAARDNGGTLEGRTIEIHSDREMCLTSCFVVLPKIGLELGNPRVIFVGPNGSSRTMQNGKWQ